MPGVSDLIDRLEENQLIEQRRPSFERPVFPYWAPTSEEQLDTVKENDRIISLPSNHEFQRDVGDEEQVGETILDQDTRRGIAKEARNSGIEALAWYVPFHASRNN